MNLDDSSFNFASVFEFKYDKANNLISYVNEYGTTDISFDYDEQNRIVSQHEINRDYECNYEYTYEKNGRLLQTSYWAADLDRAESYLYETQWAESYKYDKNGCILEAVTDFESGNCVSDSCEYDKDGNLILHVHIGFDQTYEYKYTYDKLGNLMNSYTKENGKWVLEGAG